MYFSHMKTKTVYILNYNGIVQYPSKDLKALWASLCQMVTRVNLPLPIGYPQLTRIMNECHSYNYIPAQGHAWEIIEREYLYTRRKKKNGNTAPEAVTNSQ